MARPLRIEFAGAFYHVTSRGNARADIFSDDFDRYQFLKLLGEAGKRFGWLCHADLTPFHAIPHSRSDSVFWNQQSYSEPNIERMSLKCALYDLTPFHAIPHSRSDSVFWNQQSYSEPNIERMSLKCALCDLTPFHCILEPAELQ